MPKGNILVTGGAGYIGSHTAVELAGAGFGVVIADDLSGSDMAAVDAVRTLTGRDVPFERVDCCDREAMAGVFARHRFDAVIHFAAFKVPAESLREPLMYYRNNLLSFINVLELMRENGVANMVFSSSAAVYGQPDTLPATEQTPRKPAASPYGNTKQMCEDILRDWVCADPCVRGIALRYFNPIGGHPSALIGEMPRGVPGNIVPFITQTAAGLHKELSVFGGDYPTPDGTALRDYIDVTDLARAHLHALERMLAGRGESYEVFNVGTGVPVSVLELVRAFERVNGMRVPYRIADRRPGDSAAVWADTSLANRELGWKAERTLDQTLATAWEWEKRLRGI